MVRSLAIATSGKSNVAAHPLVLLVRGDTVDPEEHPEPAIVDGAVTGSPPELVERRLRHQRDRASLAVDRAALRVGAREPQRPAGI